MIELPAGTPRVLDVGQACAALTIRATKLYALVGDGELPASSWATGWYSSRPTWPGGSRSCRRRRSSRSGSLGAGGCDEHTKWSIHNDDRNR